MNTKRHEDRAACERAAHCTLSYYDATQRLDSAALRWFRFIWRWSAPRFTSDAGMLHDQAFARLGRERYQRRIQRVRAFAARLKARS